MTISTPSGEMWSLWEQLTDWFYRGIRNAMKAAAAAAVADSLCIGVIRQTKDIRMIVAEEESIGHGAVLRRDEDNIEENVEAEGILLPSIKELCFKLLFLRY